MGVSHDSSGAIGEGAGKRGHDSAVPCMVASGAALRRAERSRTDTQERRATHHNSSYVCCIRHQHHGPVAPAPGPHLNSGCRGAPVPRSSSHHARYTSSSARGSAETCQQSTRSEVHIGLSFCSLVGGLAWHHTVAVAVPPAPPSAPRPDTSGAPVGCLMY